MFIHSASWLGLVSSVELLVNMGVAQTANYFIFYASRHICKVPYTSGCGTYVRFLNKWRVIMLGHPHPLVVRWLFTHYGCAPEAVLHPESLFLASALRSSCKYTLASWLDLAIELWVYRLRILSGCLQLHPSHFLCCFFCARLFLNGVNVCSLVCLNF